MSGQPLEVVTRRATAGQLLHVRELEARTAETVDWPGWVPPQVREAYAAQGVTSPWSHQRVAADLVRAGQHVVLSTGTASGKSLAYQLPALTALHEGRGGSVLRDRAPTVLYLSPTKALAHDQLAAIRTLGADLDGVRAAAVDGDNSREERRWARDHATFVVTNPDMLHRSVLPGHARWARLLAGLRYVVVDECHHYRGVFGSHVAHVLRRLRRLAESLGASPTFVLASATASDPGLTARRLTGLDVVEVTHDGAPRGARTVGLWEPPLDEHAEAAAPTRRPAQAEVADLLCDLVSAGTRTLAFVRSRRGAETLVLRTRRLLDEVDPTLGRRIEAYRGGYLPEDRRELEAALRDGTLLGLASTNALELGIDIAGLDAVVVLGFPGTRAALWQQLGRAGRTGGGSLGLMVARDDPLDAYLVRHPEALLDAPVEATVLDPANPYVLGPHLAAAAQELPLTAPDLELFGAGSAEAVDALTAAGLLRRRPRGWFWTSPERACDLADIRSTGGDPVQIVQGDTGRLVGTVDAGSAHSTVHEGAVYVHRGDTYVVEHLDLETDCAVVRRDQPDHSTTARDVTDIAVVGIDEQRRWGPATLAYGTVDVTQQVVSYVRRALDSSRVLAEVPLDLPARTLTTRAVWWTLEPEALAASGVAPDAVPGAAHAAEHASIGLLPLFATCDRWDIGGVSTALHRDTGRLSVFVYDGHPGGAGFARRGFDRARDWLATTRRAIADCPCHDGCPTCVQSPKCGNGNHPLDKAGAVRLLDLVLAAAGEGEGDQIGSRPDSHASSPLEPAGR